MLREDGILVSDEVDETYTSDEMISVLGLTDKNGGICDGYAHLRNCNWCIQEVKTRRHITKAIRQLENSLIQLKSIGRKVHKAIIIIEKIDKNENKKYDVVENRLIKKNGKKRILLMDDIPLYIIKEKQLSHMVKDKELIGCLSM